jgi:hypothetical protein
MFPLQNLFRRKQLYFLHIPKTAGTSVSNCLSEIAAKKDLKMVGPILIDHLIERPQWENSDLLVGHLGLLPLKHKFQYFTILRDPLDRLYSYYSHVKRDPVYFIHNVVAGENLSFEEYLLDDRFFNINFNMQARYLSMTPKMDNLEIDTVFAQLAYTFENSETSSISLDTAISTLENALWVGDQNDLSSLGKFLEGHFGFSDIKFPFLNNNPGEFKKFTSSEIEAAKPLIELDTMIYGRWKNKNRY